MASDDACKMRVVLPDGRQLWIELGPQSAYEEACEGDGAWGHTFETQDASGTALFWDKEGPGPFDVGISDSRDELLLLQTWVDDECCEQLARAFVASPTGCEETLDVTFETSGRVAVAYSPFGWADVIVGDRDQALATDAVATLSANEDKDVAAVLSLQAGKYAAAIGYHDPEDDSRWSCLWCRLRLQR